MLTSSLIALALTLAPSLVSAGLFPPDSTVKMLDHKGFKKAMKANQTSMVAFVAPWCGHCQKMGPEFSRAALGLYPLVPAYAVDCDDAKNKRLCADQGVQGFPTVKLFPRGNKLGAMTYDAGERTASAFFYWASRRVPNYVNKLFHVEDIEPWVQKTVSSKKHRILLLTKEKKIPLLWKVLANKYQGELELASHRDRRGKSSVILGYEAGEKKDAKVLIYPAGTTTPIRYQGINKLDSLSKFFDTVLDGTADLSVVNEEASNEEFVPDEEELEIERKQEAQRIALAHGGFVDLIDFEEAIKSGAGADFHDVNGYPGMMGGMPKKKSEDTASKASEQAPAGGFKTADPHASASAEETTVPRPEEVKEQTKVLETEAERVEKEEESKAEEAEDLPLEVADQIVLEAHGESTKSTQPGECGIRDAGLADAEPSGGCSPPTTEKERPKDEL